MKKPKVRSLPLEGGELAGSGKAQPCPGERADHGRSARLFECSKKRSEESRVGVKVSDSRRRLISSATMLSAALGVVLLLGACSTVDHWFDRERDLQIKELRRLPSCGVHGQGPEPKVHYFYDAESVEAWEQERGVQLTDLDPRVQGPFALVELGERGLEGYGVLVSPEARIHSDGRLELHSTFFYAPQTPGRRTEASPCVLLALPPVRYSLIELYDQQGTRQASASARPRKN
jgi:hypothetical protein